MGRYRLAAMPNAARHRASIRLGQGSARSPPHAPHHAAVVREIHLSRMVGFPEPAHGGVSGVGGRLGLGSAQTEPTGHLPKTGPSTATTEPSMNAINRATAAMTWRSKGYFWDARAETPDCAAIAPMEGLPGNTTGRGCDFLRATPQRPPISRATLAQAMSRVSARASWLSRLSGYIIRASTGFPAIQVARMTRSSPIVIRVNNSSPRLAQ